MTEWHEQSHKTYFFALSLLIHLALFVVLLKITNQDQGLFEHFMQPELTAEKQPLTMPPTQVAALKSGRSSFGAPVIFHEQTEVKAQENDQQGNDAQTDDGTEQQDAQESQQNTAMPLFDQQQKQHIAKDQPQEYNEPSIDEQKTIPQQLPDQKQEKVSVQKTELPVQKKEITVPPQKPQQQTPPTKKTVRKKIAQRTLGDSSRTAAPLKKQLTLADLAEGFIDTLNRGGHDSLDRDGDDSIRPDFQELKYLSYTRKVVWYMQNEWRATQDRLKVQLSHEYIVSLVITFLKDGTVGTIRLVQESGCPQLDEFLIRGIRNAGPYPPLPNHFNSDSFDLPLNIHNAAESSQPWHMNLARQLGSRR